MKAISYTRVSTDEQAQSGLGLEAQRAKIAAALDARGWTLTNECTDEGVSGKVAPQDRPGLAHALQILCDGKADALIVAKLDRVSRSAFDLLWLRKESDRCGWALIVLDPEIDTSTPAGRFQFTVMCGVAELERDLIAQRTREALAAKKARGARLGRPVTMDTATRSIVAKLRADGLSIAKTAEALNAQGHRNGKGGLFTRSAVQKIDRSIKLDSEAATAVAVA